MLGLRMCSIVMLTDADTHARTCSFESRVLDSAPSQELQTAAKLRYSSKKRTYKHKTRKKAKKKLRAVYCSLHLPRLPTEIIVRILSYLDSRNTVNMGNGVGLTVTAYGLLPYLILNPYLFLPPYCKYFDPGTKVEHIRSLSLEDINDVVMEMRILAESNISSHVSLYVYIHTWPRVRDTPDLRLLLQIPRRWRELGISFGNVEHISPVFDTLAPCLPHLQELHVKFEDVDRRGDLSPLLIDSVASMAMTSSKEIYFPFYALPLLFNKGIFDLVTTLCLDNSFSPLPTEGDNTCRNLMKNLPHILSDLPCLESLTLSLNSPTYYEDYRKLRLRSDSLRDLSLLCMGNNQAPFLEIFLDCPIEALSFNYQAPDFKLAHVARFFPSVRKLSYVSSLTCLTRGRGVLILLM